MTGTAPKNTEQFEPNPLEATRKLVATRWPTLSESQHAGISPKDDRPSRHETKPESSFK